MSSYSLDQVQRWSHYLQNMLPKIPSLQDSSLWQEALQDGQMYQDVYDTVVAAEDDVQLLAALRQKRNYYMSRIALRDLSGLAELAEVMRDCSDLADALVAASLDWNYKKLEPRFGVPIGEETGKPQKMLVIGMGKLGGQELNFSSDIDLIFAYAEKGMTEGGRKSVSNEEFFTRLAKAMNKSLVDYTDQGIVYRVDMRLRPFGDAGPLVSSFASLEHYYEIHGRAWERYALIKARVMAGGEGRGIELFNVLRPFVYRRYIDFSAMDSLRELKQMIAAQVEKKGMRENIKLGPGGIREVEFIVQAFQLVHGGRNRQLQGRQLLPTLAYLLKSEFVQQDQFQGLKAAYTFLRRAENRLQMWDDRQTHSLPEEPERQQWLAESMGFANYADFMEGLNQHRQFVMQEFAAVFAEDDMSEQADAMAKLWMQEQAQTELEFDVGFQLEGEERALFAKRIHDFRQSRAVARLSVDGTERLNAVMPLLLEALFENDYSDVACVRALNVLENILSRSVYLVLLKENPGALKHLVKLVRVSSWMADMLAKYPALFDQLLDNRSLYEPLDLQQLYAEVDRLLAECGDDEELFMQEIRIWRHAQVFRVAAADVTGNVPIMHVSDYLTWIAQSVLKAVVDFAWRLMRNKNGVPGGLSVEDPRNPFLILGYGKLGGIELGYGSDLDIVLLYEGVSPSDSVQMPEGKAGRAIGNSVFFVRMGQKVISLMTTVMPAGVLYEVDTRLRPNGASGIMVNEFMAYQNYIENNAWNWEHQALVRARAVVGDEQAVEAFESFRSAYIGQKRDREKVRSEVVEMRQKMKDQLDKSNDELFDLKQGAGGIVDIEFMMQYLVLAYAYEYSDLKQFSDNMRILEAVERHQLLSSEQVACLMDSYKTYRSKYHRLALQNETQIVPASCYELQRENVIKIWQKLMLDN